MCIRDRFKITLPNINFYTEEQEKQIVFKTGNSLNTNRKRKQMNEVLELCRTNGFVIRKDVEKALGISQATSIVLLRDMVKADILVKEGKSKNLRYYEKRQDYDIQGTKNTKYSDKRGGNIMPTLSEIFDKRKIFLYQNESLDLDYYYKFHRKVVDNLVERA